MKYVTRQGDTFDEIAYRELGDVRHVSALIDANRQYASTQMFESGMELTLPTVESGKVVARPPWED